MRWSLRIGTIAGIRIELHVTFLAFIVWIAISAGLLRGDVSRALNSVLLMLLLFACVLLHELGHALTARRFGIRTRDIILLPIGGLARLTRMPEKPWQEILVALAGPAVNLVIATLLWVVNGMVLPSLDRALNGALFDGVFWVNVAMLLFNLTPAYPMDGGRVLRAGLAMNMPYEKATRIAATTGQAIALCLGIFGLVQNAVMLVFVALFVFLAASEERAMMERRATLSGLPVRNAMVTEFHVLDARDPLRRAVDHLMAGSQQDFPVLDGDVPIGILSRSDLVHGLRQHGDDAPVGAVMRRDQDHAEAGEPLDQAVQRMREHARTALPVLHEGGLVGLITIENVGDLLSVRDALRRYQRNGRA